MKLYSSDRGGSEGKYLNLTRESQHRFAQSRYFLIQVLKDEKHIPGHAGWEQEGILGIGNRMYKGPEAGNCREEP